MLSPVEQNKSERQRGGAMITEREVPVGPALLTTTEACEYLGGVHKDTLREWARRHRIKVVKISPGPKGHVRWRRVDLDRLVDLSSKQLR
jgi:excisionase family DNA binding protein